jgi:hypothetical protein
MLAHQRIPGCFAMIEQDFFPVAVGMAGHAFHAVVALMFVVLLVTCNALSRCVLERVVSVTGAAFDADVLAKDVEPGLAMIEMQCLPILLFMAALACLAQRALVLVLLGMAAIAGFHYLPVFVARGMAILAQDLLGQMPTLQFKSGLFRMIEVLGVEFDQRNISPLVFVVALIADLLLHMLTMQAMLGEFILRNLFVATLAQVRLGSLVEMFMAAAAVAFNFGMPFYYRTGHQHIAA